MILHYTVSNDSAVQYPMILYCTVSNDSALYSIQRVCTVHYQMILYYTLSNESALYSIKWFYKWVMKALIKLHEAQAALGFWFPTLLCHKIPYVTKALLPLLSDVRTIAAISHEKFDINTHNTQ